MYMFMNIGFKFEHGYHGLQDIKRKEPMEEEDDILDRSSTTYSKNTIGI
jgi:hypothetical protein